MIVSTYLTSESILIDPEFTDKGDLIRKLVAHLPGLDQSLHGAVVKAVLEREDVLSTGVGNGIAIPHSKVESLQEPTVGFALLRRPIDFGSHDGLPVDLVFLVAGSNKSNSIHIKVLSALSKILIQQRLVDALRNSRSPAEVIGYIQLAEANAI